MLMVCKKYKKGMSFDVTHVIASILCIQQVHTNKQLFYEIITVKIYKTYIHRLDR